MRAAGLLRKLWPTIVFSHVYRSSPQEVTDQPDFLNAVARFETEDSPEDIAAQLREIEQTLGKAPPFRFGPRTIDLDILLFKEKIIPNESEWLSNFQFPISNSSSETTKLILPHPRLHLRRFVLEPLCELIDPQAMHPLLNETYAMLLEKTRNQCCTVTSLELYT